MMYKIEHLAVAAGAVMGLGFGVMIGLGFQQFIEVML